MRTDDAYRGWDSETRYRRLLDDLIPLDLGGWRLPEVRAALSTLGWELRPVGPGEGVPDLARGRLGRRWRGCWTTRPGGPGRASAC